MRMGTTELRQSIAGLLRRVAKQQDRIIIERRGKPLAAIVPLADLQVPQAVLGSGDDPSLAAFSFEAIFETALVGMAILSTDGRFQKANKAYHSFVGYPADELLGHHFSQVIDAADLAAVSERLRQLLAGEVEDYLHERRYRHKSGAIVWGLAGIFALRDDQGTITGFVVQVQDITSRKQQDEQVRESEFLLRQAAELADLGFWVWDEKLDRCIHCSETLARMNGVSVEQYLERFGDLDSMLHYVHPEDRERYTKVTCEAAEKKIPYRIEYRDRARDGIYRYYRETGDPVLDDSGRLLRTVGTLQNIDSHKQIERSLEQVREQLEQEVERRTAELRASQGRFQDFAEASADWFWETDAENRFTFMSENVLEVVGVPAEWHYGKSRNDILERALTEGDWETHKAVIKSRQPFRNFVFRRIGSGIEPRWIRSSGTPRFAEDGAFLGYRGSGGDVTEEITAQETLRQNEERYRELFEDSPLPILEEDWRPTKALVERWSEQGSIGLNGFATAALSNSSVSFENTVSAASSFRTSTDGRAAPRPPPARTARP